MPQRPRSHQLESASQKAFENALPDEWVARRQTPDYGVDYTVEIFNGGASTGRIFNVQLKSTDEANLARALGGVRFRRETADYYRSLSAPVLIVLYHAPSEQLFARWFHAYNPHVATGKGWDADAKTVRFQFYESDRLGPESPALIDAGLRGFLAFRSSELSVPLHVALTSDALTDEDRYRAALAMRDALSRVAGLVTVEVREPSADDTALVIGPERSVVSLADVASVTLDEALPSAGSAMSAFAADIALSLAVALTYVGQPNMAAQIAWAVAASSHVIEDPEVAFTVAGAMFRSQRFNEAIQLADELDASTDDARRMAAHPFLMALLAQGPHLGDNERREAASMSERRVERRIAADDSIGAASESYSLGMTRRNLKDWPGSIEAFRAAAKLDDAYLRRSYYHRDLASALFGNGDFADAAEHYAKAIELGADRLTGALYADALLFSGEYGLALEAFGHYLAEAGGPDAAEWRLKHLMLEQLIASVGPRQQRDPETAIRLLSTWDFENGPDMSHREAWMRCEEAVTHDACCYEAWFRLGLLSVDLTAEKPTGGAMYSLMAGLLGGSEVSWGNAVLSADFDDPERIADICLTGYNQRGDSFVRLVTEIINNAGHLDGHRALVLKCLDDAVTHFDSTRMQDGVTVRYRREDGEMDEFIVGGATDEEVPPSGPTWRPASARPGKSRRKRPPKTHGKNKAKRKRRR